MPKNAQTTRQLYSSHMLARSCSKSSKLGFNSTWTENFQMFKLDLEKAEEPEIKLTTSVGSSKKAREFQKNIYFCFIDYNKAFDYVDCKKNCGKFLNRWEHQTTLPAPWEMHAVQVATVRTRHGTTDWFQIGKGVHQVCILSPCLFNLHAEYIMRNTGLDEAQVGIKIAGEISITSDMQITPLLWQKVKRNWRASWWK